MAAPAAAAATASSSSGAVASDSISALGSVLPSRFLPVALRWLLQDLNPCLYSIPFMPNPLVDLIPFMPNPLVDLIADDAAEEEYSSAQAATVVQLSHHTSLSDLTLISKSGRNCVADVMAHCKDDDDAEEYDAISDLAWIWSKCAGDLAEVVAWKTHQGLPVLLPEGVRPEEVLDGFTDEQKDEAATLMARMLVTATNGSPDSSSMPPALAKIIQEYPTLLPEIRARTVRLRSSPERALALWGDRQASSRSGSNITSFSRINPTTGQLEVSVLTHDGRSAKMQETAADKRMAASTPPPYITPPKYRTKKIVKRKRKSVEKA